MRSPFHLLVKQLELFDSMSTFDTSTCPQLEIFGVDTELSQLFKSAMSRLQEAIVAIKNVGDPEPAIAAVRLWTIHYGILLFGTCDAARVLITHNLAREAWMNQRHAFELLVRAAYFGMYPSTALTELRAAPVRRFRRLELERGVRDEAFESLRKESEEAIALYPELATFKLPSLEQMIESDSGIRDALYSAQYRDPSGLVHGSVLSFSDTMRTSADGSLRASFDSRQSPRRVNEIVTQLVSYLLGYRFIIAGAFELPDPVDAREQMRKLEEVTTRIVKSLDLTSD